MEFLVQADISLPRDLSDQARAELIKAESLRAAELAAEGIIRRVWRVPGRFASWGIWSAPDATELHKAVTSLPMWQFMDLHVHPLSTHPNDPGPGRL